MTDPVKKFGDAALARKVIEVYAEGAPCSDYLDEEELGLESSGPEDALCDALKNVDYGIGTVPDDGAIKPGEKEKLEAVGFSQKFISELAGPDGRRALKERAKWLSDHITAPWYRPNLPTDKREAMVRELFFYGKDSAVALPHLLEILEEHSSLDSLKDGEHDLMQSALHAIRSIHKNGGNIDEAAEPLIRLIAKNKSLQPNEGLNQEILRVAVLLLGQMGPKAKPALPHLKEMYLKRQMWELPEVVAKILVEDVPALLEDLNNENPGIRLLACRALRFHGHKDSRTVPALMEKIKTDSALRNDAILSLDIHGKWAKGAIPLLAEIYRGSNTDERTRDAIIETLIAIQDTSPEALAIFEDYIGRDSNGLHYKHPLIRNLDWLGRKALPILFKALGDKHLRDSAAEAIAKIGLQVEDIGPLMAVEVSPDFHPTYYLRSAYESLKWSLAKIGLSAAPPLAQILKEAEGVRFELAMDVLKTLGIGASAAAPELYVLARDFKKRAKEFKKLDDVEVAGANLGRAVDIMGIFRHMGSEAVPVLVGGLKEDDPDMTYLCLSSIRDIGEEAKEALPVVLSFLENPDPFLRATTVSTLEAIAPEDDTVLMHIIAALQDPHSDVRWSAAITLRELAHDNANPSIYLALPLLVAARDNAREEERVRNTASDAIKAIEEKVL